MNSRTKKGLLKKTKQSLIAFVVFSVALLPLIATTRTFKPLLFETRTLLHKDAANNPDTHQGLLSLAADPKSDHSKNPALINE